MNKKETEQLIILDNKERILYEILKELKVVIDHTTNKGHADRLFKCYEQLETYIERKNNAT